MSPMYGVSSNTKYVASRMRRLLRRIAADITKTSQAIATRPELL